MNQFLEDIESARSHVRDSQLIKLSCLGPDPVTESLSQGQILRMYKRGDYQRSLSGRVPVFYLVADV